MAYTLHTGDCLDVMATMPESSIDTIISDPPYGLEFMGESWDRGVPGVPFWTEALRVAKPGATMLAFGGTRTQHRLTVAIEDAGWVIRDVVMYLYGIGFPKSHNISKAIDKAAGAEREVVGMRQPFGREGRAKYTAATGVDYGEYNTEIGGVSVTAPATDAAQLWDGYGTALKPAYEPIIVAMKPCDGTFANNALTYGVAGLWIDGARVGTEDDRSRPPRTKNAIYGNGNGTNQTASESHPSGRWPANIIHDGSDEVTAGFPVTGASKQAERGKGIDGATFKNANGELSGIRGHNDNGGSAARYFYCAKASRSERNAGLDGMPKRQKYAKNGQGGSHEIFTSESANDDEWAKKNPNKPAANHHPTVKPLALMRYLAKLTRTPTGGTVLDPFMGSGSTGVACIMEGRPFVGIELDADYVEIARRRIEAAILPIFEGG